jgi:mannonate dehydratase
VIDSFIGHIRELQVLQGVFSAIIAAMVSSRRSFLTATAMAGLGIAGWAAWRFWPEQGLLNPCLGELPPQLANHPLVQEAWAGVDPHQVWDAHAHLLGVGDDGNSAGAAFNDGHDFLSLPLVKGQRYFFLNATCLADDGHVDRSYVDHLKALVTSMPAGHKLLLLALDAWHAADGKAQLQRSHIYIANDYCATVARSASQHFEWAASVHPYRKDALSELERVKHLGARAIKWIPAAQGIDPAAAACDNFYARLVQLDLPLITHAGEERATPGDDALGNPLRLRRALEHGVRVVMAHCASMGASRDLDQGKDGAVWVDNFKLFERMMEEPANVGRLFGDMAALTQNARAGVPLQRVLQRAAVGGDWAGRLLNGSDYPLPAIMPLFSPRFLAEAGYLAKVAVAPLTQIRRHHPLLFDFVLKRQLEYAGKRLAPAVFETRRFFAGSP